MWPARQRKETFPIYEAFLQTLVAMVQAYSDLQICVADDVSRR